MRPPYVTESYLQAFISMAIAEDLGPGDHSTLATIPEKLRGRARLLIKAPGILAGSELAERLFAAFNADMVFDRLLTDGDEVTPGDIAFIVSGPVRPLLGAERLVLNCMQRMSGIATRTRQLCRLIEGTHTRILDTRKTAPLLRPLDKWAVLIGGGRNHRIGLYDLIMLKDNHIDFAGGIAPAVASAVDYRNKSGLPLRIEVETRNLQEVEEAMQSPGVDIIMLDNMDIRTMAEAVVRIGGKAETEASGNIDYENLAAVAACGVDYISIGALTHSVQSLDMSLKAEIE